MPYIPHRFCTVKERLKNADKKSQTSERKNTQMSLIFHLFFCILFWAWPHALESLIIISRILLLPWSNTEIFITAFLKIIRLMPRSFPISSAVGRSLSLYQSVLITPQRRPAQRLTETDYQYITKIWETAGKHHEHVLHILHPISTISNVLFILCH